MLFFSTANCHSLVCLFSALPHMQSLRSLRLMELGQRTDWEWTKLECYWMSYACFNLRPKASSWNLMWLLIATMNDEARDALMEIQHDPIRALSVTRLTVVAGVVPVQFEW